MKIVNTLASLLVSGACVLGSGEKAKSESLFNDNFDNNTSSKISSPWEVVYFGGCGEPLSNNPGNLSAYIFDVNNPRNPDKLLSLCDGNGSNGMEVRVNFQPTDKAVLDFCIYPSNTSPFISLRGDKGIDYSLFFDVDNIFKVQDNWGKRNNVMPFTSNNWYHITRELDCKTNQGSLFIEECDNPSNNAEISLGSSFSHNYINQLGFHCPVSIFNVPACYIDNISVTHPTPEPSSLGLLATGLAAGIGAYSLRRKK
jgi:hypothetical protein